MKNSGIRHLLMNVGVLFCPKCPFCQQPEKQGEIISLLFVFSKIINDDNSYKIAGRSYVVIKEEKIRSVH
ncbi:hypothetical protein [Kandleria vitulina]|uniref:hypothetical protein n=1 Tax=Kandleria vitulina TaxID=1630 RepID=UPI000944C732|nr:hypothetical protein [Kandleria vitulina]